MLDHPQEPETSVGEAAPHIPESARRRRPGVIEALIALCVVVSLSGVVLPIVGGGLESGREQQVLADMIAIGEGLEAYSRDTLFLPTGVEGRTNVAWLYGPGALPEGNTFAEGGEARPLDDALLSDAMGGGGWQGPYVGGLSPDPWGHAYLVNVDGLVSERERALVLCAGPNGIVETGPTATRAAGDDVIYLLE